MLVQESIDLIKWFADNLMQANPDKFQAICIGKKTYEAIKHFQMNDTAIQCQSNVSLSDVHIDFMLNFNDHVGEIFKNNNIKTTCYFKETREISNTAREINHF